MKTSTKDQVEGKLHKVKGKIEETVGKLSNNPDLEVKGRVEKIESEAQEKVGHVKKVFGQVKQRSIMGRIHGPDCDNLDIGSRIRRCHLRKQNC